MGGMSFDDFDEFNEDVLEENQKGKSEKELLAVQAGSNLPISTMNPEIQYGMSSVTAAGASSIGLVAGIIDRAFALADSISRCVTLISVEKQRTKQIQAQSQAFIAMAEEKTRQTRIEEKEKTKRFALECKTRLEEKKIELKEIEKELHSQEKGRRLEHHKIMKELDILESVVQDLIRTNESLRKRLDNCENKDEVLFKISDNSNQLISLLREFRRI